MRKFFLYSAASLLWLTAVTGVARGQSITLISPNTEGLTWSHVREIRWETSGFSPGDTVILELSSDGGVAYDTVIARNLPHDLGKFRFYTTVLANGSSYRVKVSQTGSPGVSAESDYNFALNNPAIGTAYYVNDASTTGDVYSTAPGDDANDGLSPAAPRLTLQTIVNDYVLGPGDVVFIDTGRWERIGRELTITSADQGSALSPIYFAGSPNGTVFSGFFHPDSEWRIYLDRSSCLTFSNLVLEEAVAQGAFMADRSHNITVDSCAIRTNTDGVLFEGSDNASVIDNLIEANQLSGLFFQGGSRVLISGNEVSANAAGGTSAILLTGISSSLLRGNTIRDNPADGLYITSSIRPRVLWNVIKDNTGHNLYIIRSDYPRVLHNVLMNPGNYNILVNRNLETSILNNLLFGPGITIGSNESKLWFLNNIVTNNVANTYCILGTWDSPQEAGIISDFNVIRPGAGARAGYWRSAYFDLRDWVMGSGMDGRSLTDDPLFFDPGEGDYHLRSTEGRFNEATWTWETDSEDSPALNAGIPADAVAELAVSLAPGASTIQLDSDPLAAGFLPGPDRVQIGTEIISYTGISGNTLTGCTGVMEDHDAGAGVFQPVGSAYGLEPEPHGDRVNIGLYGNTPQASKSSRKSLLVTSPRGGPVGLEVWSGEHPIDWRSIGDGWEAGDTLDILYSDTSEWPGFTIAEDVPYDSRPFPAWNTLSVPDTPTGRLLVGNWPDGPYATSGIFAVDNTPPVVGALTPEDGADGQGVNSALIALEAEDALAGLHPSAYYFRIDTVETFDSPDLQTSDWLAGRAWYPGLDSGTNYYWQVRARDDADPPNISDFFAETAVPGSYRKFRTALVLYAEDIESETTGLRWMLENYDLGPGDKIYVEPGTYALEHGPLILPLAIQGDEDDPLRIEGLNGEVVIDGQGLPINTNCLRVTGDYFLIENLSFTGAVGTGVVITGNHNILQEGRSFLNGGDGVQVTGDYNTVRNMLAYGNLRAGFRLTAAYRNRLINNTAAGNGTRGIYIEDIPPNGSIDTLLSNNILTASGSGRTALDVESASRSGLNSDYNLLHGTGGAVLGRWGGTEIATFSQWTEASGGDLNSLSAPPLFVGGGNYRLQSTAGSYKPGLGPRTDEAAWTPDGNDSPGLSRGDPLSVCYLETAPSGGRINLGAYGNTLQASRSPGGGGRNYFVNDDSTDLDYFCAAPGKSWAEGHTGLTPHDPLDSIQAVFNHHTLKPGDTIYVDTGNYLLTNPVVPPISGSAGRPLTFAGSPRGTILDAEGVSAYCFELRSKDHITIGGFVLPNAGENSLFADNSRNLRFSRNQAVGAIEAGVHLWGCSEAAVLENRINNNSGHGIDGFSANISFSARGNRLSGNLGSGIFLSRGHLADISENTVLDNAGGGITVSRFDHGGTVRDNTVKNNGPGTATGIAVFSSPDILVTGNTVSGSHYGFENTSIRSEISGNRVFENEFGFWNAANDSRLVNNVVYNNHERGIYLRGGHRTSILNNVLYNNGLFEVSLFRGLEEIEIKNNVIAPRGAGNYGVFVSRAGPEQENRFDYNIFWLEGDGALFGSWVVDCDNFWSWQTQSRQDGHSFAADPLFADPGAGNFHLRSRDGRFSEGKWVFVDGEDSPGLNRGDPDDDFSRELPPIDGDAGNRINIGVYGNTPRASRSSIRSLAVTSPVGTAAGEEKWSRAHPLTWRAIGEGWTTDDLFALDYSPDGVNFTAITEGIPWPVSAYPAWDTDTPAIPDGDSYQVRVRQTAGGTAQAVSGLFIVDNTPPVNVGCWYPADGADREPVNVSLLVLTAEDSPAGLADAPYYIEIDTADTFDSPDLQNSGWREFNSWNPSLAPDTRYYWRVKARDDAVPPNESAFFGETDSPDSYRTFRTIGVYHATNVDETGDTDDLRMILETYELQPGNIVYLDSGDYLLDPALGPLELAAGNQGDELDPVRIIGVGGEVLLRGNGEENCLVISGDYFRVENFSFTEASGSGLLITGDHNIVQSGRSFDNGGDGIFVTGDRNIIRNMLVYGNSAAGIHLFTAHHNTLENNTVSGNETFEVFLRDEPPNEIHPERPVGSTHASLRNNILDAAGAGSLAIYLDPISQTGFSADYNLFHTAGGADVGYWDSETRSSFSDWTGASGADSNSIFADPLFVNPGEGNYRLQSTRGSYKGTEWPPRPEDWTPDPADSPGLDAGDPLSLSFYEPAPHGGRADLGAFGNTVEASWSIGSTFGTNYYVNDSSIEWSYYCTAPGSPDNTGLSPDSPLDSIQAVIDSHSLLPGDTIYVDTGLYFIDAPIIFPRHGDEDNPIKIVGSPRGTIIDGRAAVDNCFSITRNHITLANLTAISPRVYGFDGRGHSLTLAYNTARGALLDGFYIWRTNNVRIVGCDAFFNEGSGFTFSLLAGNTGLFVRDCTAANNSGAGFDLNRGINNTIISSSARDNIGHGFNVSSAYGSTTFTDNRSEGNQGIGFNVRADSSSTGTVVRGNRARDNREEGFFVVAPKLRVESNRSEENTGAGFYLLGSRFAELFYNVSARNLGFGFRIERAGGSFLINNVSYKNAGEVRLRSTEDNIDLTLRNNILWASGTGRQAILSGSSDPPSMGWISNYNCLLAEGGAFIGSLGDLNYSTLFDWQFASGLDGVSINLDPVFVDPEGGDFHIQSPLGSYHGGYWKADLNASPALNQGQVGLAQAVLTSDIFPASLRIRLDDASDFTAGTGLIEINGDIILYTGVDYDEDELITSPAVSRISASHPAGSRVFQPVGSDYTREPEPHGQRVDIGAHGGMGEASLALRKTLPVLRPLGGEKWSGVQNLRWLAIPADEWDPTDEIEIEYSTDGFTTSHPIDTVHYPTQEYDWDTEDPGADGSSYQIRVIGGGLTTSSGVFTIDNTPPTNVGCLFPGDGESRLPTYIPLRGRETVDELAGLHAQPYYFQISTSPAFDTEVQNSGWISRNAWRPNLEPGTTYFWRVKARDSADPPNVSELCGFTPDTPGYGTFSTAQVFRATNIDQTGDDQDLRVILADPELGPGDTVMVDFSGQTGVIDPGAGPITVSAGGSRYFPLRIAGVGEGALFDGAGIDNCLVLEADYVILENLSFTGAVEAGLLVTGANNIVREGESYGHGGLGVEITGAANKLVNFLTYGSDGAGVLVSGSEGNRVVNVTSHGNLGGEAVFEDAPYSYLRNSILWATAPGARSVSVDAASETGFASDYNNLHATGGASVGYWGGDRADLAAWQGASGRDGSSLSADPLFFDPAGGDYHLKSTRGRWSGWLTWTTDDVETSPSIDAGDPDYPYYRQSSPKGGPGGGRINQGAYGNTIQASRSPGGPGRNIFVNDGSLTDNLFTTAVGSDGNSGLSPAVPKRTVDGPGGALSIDLEPGDTVFIDTGEYFLSRTALVDDRLSGSAAHPVAFVGSPNTSLVDGNFVPRAGFLIQDAEHIVFDRLHSAGALGDPALRGSGYGIRTNRASSIIVRDSVISWHGQAAGEGGGGIWLANSENILLEGNRVAFTTAHGILLERGNQITLADNLVWNNTRSGIDADRETGLLLSGNTVFNNQGLGISLDEVTEGKVEGNTVYSNLGRGIRAVGTSLDISRNLVYDNDFGPGVATRAGIQVSGSGLKISNNTIYRNRGDQFLTFSAGVHFRNNIAWADGPGSSAVAFENISGQFSDFNLLHASGGAGIGRWTSSTAATLNEWQLTSRLDSHSLEGDPLFVNQAGPDGILGGTGGEDDDFHLQSVEGSFHWGRWLTDGNNSPGLNAGSPFEPFDRETAPDGGRVNIGAYGNTPQASRSGSDTLYLSSPYGGRTVTVPSAGTRGGEKWSGAHDLTWSAFGDNWGGGRTVDFEYATDGVNFTAIASGVAWDQQTYSAWDTSPPDILDGITYQIRVVDSGDPEISSISGRFMVDNSPPINIGAAEPDNGFLYVDPDNVRLRARGATDLLAGLHPAPYYFRVDTTPDFNSPNLITSGWVESRDWDTGGLLTDEWYYWQVRARDDADLPNVSDFCADLNVVDSTWLFKTVRVYHVTEVEGDDELRHVLDNQTLEPGDIVRLRAAGDFFVDSPVVIPDRLEGIPAHPVRIEGYQGRPLVRGDGEVDFLFDVQGSHVLVDGIDFTGSGGSGLIVSGDNNTVNACLSYEQGGAGVEVTGNNNQIQNTICYLNAGEGILLDGGTGNRVYNNTLYGNRTAGLRLLSSPDSNLRNNISWSLGTGTYAIAIDDGSQTAGLVSDFNCLYSTEDARIGLWGEQTQAATIGAWRTISERDASSISANPQFYQVGLPGERIGHYIYDFHLRSPDILPRSPCIDAGTSGGGIPTVDFDGEPRPSGDGVDIGADEFRDTHGNQLPDYWEIKYFGYLDPDRRADDDPDGDLLTNIQEYQYYTDPTNPDTDGDGLSDYDEVFIWVSNPLNIDSDGDRLLDGFSRELADLTPEEISLYEARHIARDGDTFLGELSLLTDPADPDTDNDWLLDGFDIHIDTLNQAEIDYFDSHNILFIHPYYKGELTVGSDPLDPDTDNDGLPDGWEVFYGLDPFDDGRTVIDYGGIGDPDGNRLNNYEEFLFGTDPTDPDDPITRYVDAAASGAGDGTSWADAWTTIGAALNWKRDHSPDDPAIVLVAGGVYNESNLELEASHAGLALMGEHPYQRPVIDAGEAGRAFTFFNLQTAKIDSFEIRNALFNGPGGAIYVFNSSPILSNLLIHNNKADGIGRGGAIFVTGDDSRPSISNCTIAKNTGFNNYGGIYVASGAPRYANNILWYNGIDLYQRDLTSETIAHSNIGSLESDLPLTIGFRGNISEEPGFRHLGANRFHLSTYFSELNPVHGVTFTGQTNPNIDAGTSAEWLQGRYLPATLADYEGEGRWNYLSQPVTGGGIPGLDYWDIGADEYVDSDYNTLLDWWEHKHWGEIGRDPAADEDGDGLTNFWEYYYLTNPLKFDTAVSGMGDLEEVIYWDITHWSQWSHNNPVGPLRWDSNPFGYGLNVLTADVDGDRLIDGFSLERAAMSAEDVALLESLDIVEIDGWFMGERTVGSDPADPDTSGNQLSDGDAVEYWHYIHNTLFPDSAPTTWDYVFPGNPLIAPLAWSTDLTEMPDGWQILYGMDPADDGYYYWTGVVDEHYGAGGDLDGDRIPNLVEYWFGTDPRDPESPEVVIVDINGTVGIDCDYNLIKDAIADTPAGQARSILVRPGVYPENNIGVRDRMAILGEFAYNTIIDAGEQRGLIFSGIENGAMVDGFTVRNARSTGPGAAVSVSNSRIFLSNMVIAGNVAVDGASPGHGAAIWAGQGSYLNLINSTVVDNVGSDDFGGVYLDDDPDTRADIINNILWDNTVDLFGAQTDMVWHNNIGDGQFAGIQGNLSVDPEFMAPEAGNYLIFRLSPMRNAGSFIKAGGFDMLGVERPQEYYFNIGAHEVTFVATPTPSVTPTPTPTMTPTPSVTPTPTPTPGPPITPTPVDATPTPAFPTRTPTPVPTATVTPPPTATPTPINFFYRDPDKFSYLDLYIDDYEYYYSIGWATETWQEIYGLPQNRWYRPRWSTDTGPLDQRQIHWSAWTFHEYETQFLEPDWPVPTATPEFSPTPTPIGYKTPIPTPSTTPELPPTTRTPTPVPTATAPPSPTVTPTPINFYYRDRFHTSYLYLWIYDWPEPDSYYTFNIGWTSDTWQPISGLPNNHWYQARWIKENLDPLEGEWFYHSDLTQWLEPEWPSPTPTPATTATPIGYRTPSPTVTPTVTPTPTPSYAYWYSAAGATEIDGIPFETVFAINNPTTDDAFVEFYAVDKDGLISRWTDWVLPESRFTFILNEKLQDEDIGRDYDESSISVMIYDTSDNIILVDRSMYWDAGGIYRGGGHNSVVSHAAAVRWALPEGATHIFDQYIHVLNPDRDHWAHVRVTFMNHLAEHWEVEKWLQPQSNWTIHVNEVVGVQRHVSTLVESLNDTAVAADRTMYFTKPGYDGTDVKWVGGHASRGTTESSTRWYIPEGATHMFDHWILVTNPHRTDEAVIRITLMDLTGVLKVIDYVIPPLARYTCYVNRELDWARNPHVSAIVESLPRQGPDGRTLPATLIMAERAMYWKPFPTGEWAAAHATIGALDGAPVWYLPEGSTIRFDQFILLTNPDEERTANVRMTFYFEEGPPENHYATITPQSRQTVYVNQLLRADTVSVRIEETTEPFADKVPIIAERSMYWHSYNPWVQWVAGHATIGIPVRIPGR